MNIEMFFVQAANVQEVSDLIRRRLKAPPDAAGLQPDWGLPPSYDVLLAKESKRKVARSPEVAGWIAGVESKEVVDFALLEQMATTLDTSVIAVQLSEVTGAFGVALCRAGVVTESRFSEDDDDPVGEVAEFLRRNGVLHGLVSFRDAVQMRNSGWMILS